MKLSAPVTVAKGKVVTITLFSMIRNMAWLDLGVHANTTVGAMCGGRAVGGVCANYPGIVPYMGDSGTTTVEAYDTYLTSVANAANADPEFLVVFDAKGTAFGGFAAQTYSPTSPANSTGAGQALSGVSDNGDGTFKIDTFGSNPATDDIDYLRVPALARLSTVGASGSIALLNCNPGLGCTGKESTRSGVGSFF